MKNPRQKISAPGGIALIWLFLINLEIQDGEVSQNTCACISGCCC